MPRLARRQLLWWSAGAAVLSACELPQQREFPSTKLPDQRPSDLPPGADRFGDSVDAACDTMLPAEFDAQGRLVLSGALEAGVVEILETEKLARLLVTQGFLAPLAEGVLVALDDLQGTVRPLLNRVLDARAQLERPGSRFAELTLDRREAILSQAFDDDTTSAAMELLRASCQLAYLGAVVNDVGLQQVGMPAFEDFAKGIASTGYPRTVGGRVDDYTFNEVPAPTPGDDLSLVIDSGGDLR